MVGARAVANGGDKMFEAVGNKGEFYLRSVLYLFGRVCADRVVEPSSIP